jgi:hypothetical protein
MTRASALLLVAALAVGGCSSPTRAPEPEASVVYEYDYDDDGHPILSSKRRVPRGKTPATYVPRPGASSRAVPSAAPPASPRYVPPPPPPAPPATKATSRKRK